MTVKDLPVSFLDKMKTLLGDQFPAYEESFSVPAFHGLRVNTLKTEPEILKNLLSVPLEPVPWISNGFYYQEEQKLSKSPYYYGGLYYLQEPSAMTPASLLPVEPGDMVLDLCAAPGGKSTELGAKLKGKGMLFANDISNSRAKALLKNLELFGIPNICVTSEEPKRLAEVFPEFFDKILIDTPCSGEGMFRRDPDMVKDWISKGPDYYRKIQETIIKEGARMLKPGGCLLYSTCTFDREEDEGVIETLLQDDPQMELVPLSRFEGAEDGIGLSGCIRLFPHRLKGEGHFLAMVRKKRAEESGADGAAAELSDIDSRRGRACCNTRHPGCVNLEKEPDLKAFLHMIKKDFEPDRIVEKNGSVYYLPEGFQPNARLRYLRTGLLMGELKKGRFEPSQALAMTLSSESFKNSLSFSSEDQRVIRYLKGETISLLDGEKPVKGWCLVCVDGFALGFAKGNGMTLKNKYYPGWRWM